VDHEVPATNVQTTQFHDVAHLLMVTTPTRVVLVDCMARGACVAEFDGVVSACLSQRPRLWLAGAHGADEPWPGALTANNAESSQ
jgi:hypothetical protein